MASLKSAKPLKQVVPQGSLRGSFAAATTETRRARSKGEEDPDAYRVPTNLGELLERAAPPTPQHLSVIEQDSFLMESLDRGRSMVEEDVVDNLQEEITLLQHALINRFRGSQKTVSGCQFRVSNNSKQLFTKCDMCDSREKALAKAREIIRRLRELTARTQSASAVSTRPSGPDDSAAMAELLEQKCQLLIRCNAAENEVETLRTRLAAKKSPAKGIDDSMRDRLAQIDQLLDQNAKLVSAVTALTGAKASMELREKAREEQLEGLTRQYHDLQARHVRHEQEHLK